MPLAGEFGSALTLERDSYLFSTPWGVLDRAKKRREKAIKHETIKYFLNDTIVFSISQYTGWPA